MAKQPPHHPLSIEDDAVRRAATRLLSVHDWDQMMMQDDYAKRPRLPGIVRTFPAEFLCSVFELLVSNETVPLKPALLLLKKRTVKANYFDREMLTKEDSPSH